MLRFTPTAAASSLVVLLFVLTRPAAAKAPDPADAALPDGDDEAILNEGVRDEDDDDGDVELDVELDEVTVGPAPGPTPAAPADREAALLERIEALERQMAAREGPDGEAPATKRLGDAAVEPEEPDARPFGFFQDLFGGVGDPSDVAGAYRISPFATMIGGGHYEVYHPRPGDQREGRFTTLALARLGVVGNLGKWIDIESELELNAGPYGTSVWEGQAAIQVRNQLVRLTFSELLYADKLVIEAGRITDPTSLNFFATHPANLMLSDALARTPILHAGFNRGNGLQARYTLFDQLTLGFNVNAGNPTSTTGTLQVGGTFPPFSRFYEVPQSSVGRDARGFPLDTFHVMLASPSVRYEWRFLKAQASAQLIHANTNTNSTKDEAILGYNLRAGAWIQAFDDLLWDNRLAFFINASRIANGVVEPDDLAKIQPGGYEAYTATTGFDLDLWGKSGIGAEVAAIRESEPGRPPTMKFFANVGGSWWFTNTTSVGARIASTQQCQDFDCSIDGRTGVYLTLRTILGPATPTRP